MPTLTEADVLFELFLPLLCESRAQAMEAFSGRVELRMLVPKTGDARDRVWVLSGGQKPWLRRADASEPIDADLRIAVSEDIVKAIVQGRTPDLEAAMARGDIFFAGDRKVLDALALSWEEAESALQTMLKNAER